MNCSRRRRRKHFGNPAFRRRRSPTHTCRPVSCERGRQNWVKPSGARPSLRTTRGRAIGIVATPRRLAPLGDQFIRGKVGQIVERLDPGFAKRDQHRLAQMRHGRQIIFHAKLAPRGAMPLFLTFQSFGGAALQFFGQLFVKPFDPGQFGHFDIGDLFEHREPFSHKQLRQGFVDIEFFFDFDLNLRGSNDSKESVGGGFSAPNS